ncbi:MAG: toll/interleukin-1 receptor domain-containing protein [Lachnospiraceae bacterium]|nr:toll/interleukin-1 receptor domain-containing protein [Lachnospiraceae bacterium]
MAPYDIPAGSRYAYVINDAVQNCSCFVLLLTNASQESQFVEREVERAITYRKTIIPVQLEDLELNSGFKFYIGNTQIIAAPEIRADALEFLRILSGIKESMECSD